jgi:hypothetical protein
MEDKPTQTSVRAGHQATDSSWFPQYLQASVYFKILSQLVGLHNIKLEDYCKLESLKGFNGSRAGLHCIVWHLHVEPEEEQENPQPA